jgi:hypothetical protein
MHWVIQKTIFKPINYQALTESLTRNNVPFITVSIPPGTLNLNPDLAGLNNNNVYVCGAIKMAKIAEQKNWYPGSFLNANYNFSIWLRELKDELLNADCLIGTLLDLDVSNLEKFFIRPTEDNKAFDGMIIERELFLSWRKSESKKEIQTLNVIVSSPKKIYSEYRFFIVEYRIVTASLYKVQDNPLLSSHVPKNIVRYVESIIDRWLPSSSVVIDVAVTDDGFKIIEFNNINSSGFYAIDIDKYVCAIEQAYNQK